MSHALVDASSSHTAEQVNRVIAGMPPALKQLYKELRSKCQEMYESNILAYWDVGELIDKAHKDPQQYSVTAVPQLADALGYSESTLDEARKLRLAFTRPEIRQLARRPMTNKMYITVSHLICICRLPRKDQRMRLLERVFAESLSAATLRGLVQDEGVRRRLGHGGRRPRLPASPRAAFRQMASISAKILRYQNVWDKAGFSAVEDLPPDELDEGFVSVIAEAETQMAALAEFAVSERDRLRKVREWAQEQAGEEASIPMQAANGHPKSSKKHKRRQLAGAH